VPANSYQSEQEQTHGRLCHGHSDDCECLPNHLDLDRFGYVFELERTNVLTETVAYRYLEEDVVT
jgi:hypothetical protein